MKTFKCIKTVQAEKMDYHTAGKKGLIRDYDPDVDNMSGYHVVYEDGYESWSPATTFGDGYVAIDDETETTNLTFGEAVEKLKKGHMVAREGWNEKGMFLYLVPGSKFKVSRKPLLGIYPEGTEIEYQPHIDMKTAQGTVVPWLVSQSDILAEDWVVVGKIEN